MPEIRAISAVTFATRDMGREARPAEALGFSMAYGGETEAFTSFRVGTGSLNLVSVDDPPLSTGRVRVIFHVDDVDAMYAHVLALGFHAGDATPGRAMGRALLSPDRPRWSCPFVCPAPFGVLTDDPPG